MIKAVCFDFYNTLAYMDPPREKFYADFAIQAGVQVTDSAIAAALPDADAFWRSENLKSPIRERQQNDKYATYALYGLQILKGANPPATPDQALQMLANAFAVGFKFLSFDDSVATLKILKSQQFKIGVISNIGQEIDGYCIELGFEPYLDFKVTSLEAGSDKPQPGIFLLALKKAGVEPSEAIFVGDQYEQDIVGARGVGIRPVLLSRNGSRNNFDCTVISSLLSVPDLIQE
jgi:FMN phosphatase YigB (HAD superfamily)